jgi:hypothetical protein
VAFAVILQGQALRVSDEISNSTSALLSRKSYFTGKPCRLQSHPLLIAKVSFIPSIVSIPFHSKYHNIFRNEKSQILRNDGKLELEETDYTKLPEL